MTRIFRPVQRFQATGNYYLHCAHCFYFGQRMQAEALATRRFSIPAPVIGKMTQAMALRRIQPTGTTAYAIDFDSVVSSNAPIVHHLMNKVLQTLPLNGQTIIRGESVHVTCLEADYNEISHYVQTDFASDISLVKGFAQSHGMALVPMKWDETFVSPSTYVCVNKPNTVTLTEACSVPLELRVLHQPMTQTDFLSGTAPQMIRESLVTDFGTTSVRTSFISRTNYRTIQTREGESEVEVLVPLNTDTTVFTNHGIQDTNISLHTAGISEVPDSISKATSTLFGIFRFCADCLAPNELDSIMCTSTFIQQETTLEWYNITVSAAWNKFRISHSSFASSEGPTTTGFVDSRTGIRNPNPSLGTPIQSNLPPRDVYLADSAFEQEGVPGLIASPRLNERPQFPSSHIQSGPISAPSRRSQLRQNRGGRTKTRNHSISNSSTMTSKYGI